MSAHDLAISAGETILVEQCPFGLPETRAYLIHKQPAFASLLFGLARPVFVEGDVLKTAATDGVHIYIAQKFWDTLDVPQAAFLIGHELLHIVLRHPERMQFFSQNGFDGKRFYPSIYNDAADYVDNDMLVDAKCGTMPSGGLHDHSVGTADDTVDDVYRKLIKDNPPKKGRPSNGGTGADSIPPPGKFDQVLNPHQEAPSEARVKREVEKAISAAKAQGNAPKALVRVFERIVEPQVDWRFLLRQAFHTARGRNRTTWRRLNRRYLPQKLLLPGRDGTVLGTVVCAFDTSGSVGANETEAYLGEVHSILEETQPKELWAVPCDARVYEPKKLTRSVELLDFAKTGLKGGGGTDFRPVFDWVLEKAIKPEVMIFCTDMYGAFPEYQPGYPVIWVSTGGDKAPFGQVIKLDGV